MPLLVHAVTGTFAVHGQAVELAGKTYRKITDINDFLDLSQAFLEAFSHFVGYQLTQRLFESAKFFPQQTDQLTAAWRRHRSPFLKGRNSSGHDLFIIGMGCLGDRANQGPIHRRSGFQQGPPCIQGLATRRGPRFQALQFEGVQHLIQRMIHDFGLWALENAKACKSTIKH